MESALNPIPSLTASIISSLQQGEISAEPQSMLAMKSGPSLYESGLSGWRSFLPTLLHQISFQVLRHLSCEMQRYDSTKSIGGTQWAANLRSYSRASFVLDSMIYV